MKPETQQKLQRLAHLAHLAQNKKIVLEELRLVSAEAFDLQDQLMAELDAAEATETNVEAVRELFEIRENVWDTINQIALREQELKEAHTSREAFKAHQKKTKSEENHNCNCHHETEDHCCCSHTADHACGCGHHHDDSDSEHACCCHGKKHGCH